jgi:FKBP-type peptidyl-prolyl cis-trans isomerase 2
VVDFMEIKQGMKVTLEYEGKLENGEVFDSSKHEGHSHPLIFEVGKKMVIPGFEEAVLGMKEGEKKEFLVEPVDAYGEYREELKQKIPRDKIPKDQDPLVGMMLMMQSPEGQFPTKIVKVEDTEITIDLNHPLAGKKLTFSIEVVKIEESDNKKDKSNLEDIAK